MNPFLLAMFLVVPVFLAALAGTIWLNRRDMKRTTTYGCQACGIPLTKFTAAQYDQHRQAVHPFVRIGSAL